MASAAVNYSGWRERGGEAEMRSWVSYGYAKPAWQIARISAGEARNTRRGPKKRRFRDALCKNRAGTVKCKPDYLIKKKKKENHTT